MSPFYFTRSGSAALFIVCLKVMMSAAPNADESISDTEQTRGMITSLFLMAENVGSWSGSFFGAAAYDNMGFECGLLVIIELQFIIVVGIPCMWCSGN